jgi:hypothetical protein
VLFKAVMSREKLLLELGIIKPRPLSCRIRLREDTLGRHNALVPQRHNEGDQQSASLFCIFHTLAGDRMPTCVSALYTLLNVPVTRVHHTSMATAYSSLQSWSVMTQSYQWPGNRSANMVYRTSPGRCLEDLRPCFIHARHNARSNDFAAV